MSPTVNTLVEKIFTENIWHNSSTIVDITIVTAEVLKLSANPRLRRRSKIATFLTLTRSHGDEVGVATYQPSPDQFYSNFGVAKNILTACEHLAG